MNFLLFLLPQEGMSTVGFVSLTLSLSLHAHI